MCDEWKAIYSAAKERSPALAPGHFITQSGMPSAPKIIVYLHTTPENRYVHTLTEMS